MASYDSCLNKNNRKREQEEKTREDCLVQFSSIENTKVIGLPEKRPILVQKYKLGILLT